MVQRYFSDKNFVRLQNDFEFLIKIIKSFKGELVFSIRDKYFNLYFRGNSAAKVIFLSNDTYRIEINKKFYDSREDLRRIKTYSEDNEDSWEKSWNIIDKEIPEIKHKLEEEFREMLGVK